MLVTQGTATRGAREREAGFTLIEVAVTSILLGVLLALAAGPFLGYRRAQQERAAVRDVVGVLRETQSRSVSEECIYRVVFSPSSTNTAAARTYTVQKKETSGKCDLVSGTWTTKETRTFDSSNVWVSATSFDNLSADADVIAGAVYFYARGTGSPGTLTISRSNKSKTYDVKVEGLTGRVSSSVV